METRSAPEVHAEPALQNDDDTAEDIVPPPPSSATARLAFAMALVALVIAAFSAASPSALQRLSDTLGPSFVVDFLTGRRASLDAQIAANADSIREIETQLSAARAQEDAVRAAGSRLGAVEQREAATASALQDAEARIAAAETLADRKSTRLNSSH